MTYHPETDGQMEQVNQNLKQYVWVYINYQQVTGSICYSLWSSYTTTHNIWP